MVIDHGRELAHGTSAELKASFGRDRVEFVFIDESRIGEATELLAAIAVGDIQKDGDEPVLFGTRG